ncbi:hypothetical protein PSHT_00654 [Puccinia striiformis]|uniref:Uncharacterized protein n=2 Tax=Puccinia striiformis TaxID=27350 RepID=A0A2S4WMI1_9BASI|nr:hypothetical protein PSTT_01759 [Puccinia striiformis]POW22962.1 hypothetical protein PSHT_00654 [Puccinia striiformis]
MYVVEEVWDVIDVRAPNNRRWSISPKTWTIHATFIPPHKDGVGTNGQVYPPLDGLYGLSWPLAPWDCSQWVALQTIDEEFNDSLEEVAGISILHTNVHCGLHIPSVHPKYRAIKTVLQQDVYDVVKLSQVPLFVLANHLSSQGDDANSSQTSYELDLLWHKS